MKPFFCNKISDRFGIACSMKDSAGQLQTVTKLRGVAEVAVVSDGHPPLLVIHFNRLAVIPVVSTCRSVSHMTDSNFTLRQCG